MVPTPSKSPRNLFVTGATGFLGSHFVHQWLRAEHGHVFALVRGHNSITAATRLTNALQVAQISNGYTGKLATKALTPIEGDVTHPLAGLTAEDISRLRQSGIETLWHFASDLRFEDHHSDFTRRVNVQGARHALDLSLAIGAQRLVYISTAFVCGRQSGLIGETPVSPNHLFSNSYEASKAEAEHLLIAECDRLGLPLTILRPSIVVGPRATQSAYGSDSGLYSLIHAAVWVRASQAGRIANLRFPACPHAELNFIPVDCVVSDMLSLANSGFGEQSIYHLTSSASVSVQECWQTISDAVGMHNISLVPPGSFDPTPAERRIARRIGFFLCYINVDRRFQRSLSPAWRLNPADLAGYVDSCLARIEDSTRELSRHAG